MAPLKTPWGNCFLRLQDLARGCHVFGSFEPGPGMRKILAWFVEITNCDTVIVAY